MKFYTLTYIFYDSANVSETLNSNLLLISTKSDIIVGAQHKQAEYIKEHIKEVHEKQPTEFDLPIQNETKLTSKLLRTGTYYYMLLINQINLDTQTTEELKVGDLVTFKPEAQTELEYNYTKYGELTPHTIVAKVIKILSDNKVKIMGCATDYPTEATTEMGNRADVPKSWLTRIKI